MRAQAIKTKPYHMIQAKSNSKPGNPHQTAHSLCSFFSTDGTPATLPKEDKPVGCSPFNFLVNPLFGTWSTPTALAALPPIEPPGMPAWASWHWGWLLYVVCSCNSSYLTLNHTCLHPALLPAMPHSMSTLSPATLAQIAGARRCRPGCSSLRACPCA